MQDDLIDDQFWALIEPLFPTRGSRDVRSAGRPRLPDRAVFSGVVFVLQSGIPWSRLPRKRGNGTGQICSRRLAVWQEAGVWPGIQDAVVDELRRRGLVREARTIVEGLEIRAVLSGKRPIINLRVEEFHPQLRRRPQVRGQLRSGKV